VRLWARATAAIDFMGCTHMGIEKVNPVTMLATPEKISVAPNDT
jgi:hypothetical protein